MRYTIFCRQIVKKYSVIALNFFTLLYLFPQYSWSQCVSDKWTQKANFSGVARQIAVGFSIGTKGYIGIGYKGYISGLGSYSLAFTNDFWEWDQATDTWRQMANFPGVARGSAVGFSIGNKGYIGIGGNSTVGFGLNGDGLFNDFYQWDQSSNTWSLKASFPGANRNDAVAFSIGSKGYIGTGYSNGLRACTNEFWEWDQASDAWIRKANFPGTARGSAAGFSIGTKGYIGTGDDGSANTKDFWEWDQTNDIWTQKADFGGAAIARATGFSIGTIGYFGSGLDGSKKNNFWQWDQTTDTWSQKTIFNGIARGAPIGFSIGCKGYIGTGIDLSASGNELADFWEYCACGCEIIANGGKDTSICNGDSTILIASGGINYLWSTGTTNKNITVAPSTTTSYSLIASDSICQDTAYKKVTVIPLPTVSAGADIIIASGGSSVLSPIGNGVSYQWTPELALNCTKCKNPIASPIENITYTITVIDFNGCKSSDNVLISLLTCGDIFIPNAFSPNSDGNNDTLFTRINPACVKEFYLVIYDRWGNKVFESIDVTRGWNPASAMNSSSPFEEGKEGVDIYFYILTASLAGNNQPIVQKGNLSLIR